MTHTELQRALTSVEPAAVLVPPRVMEHVIRQVLQLSAMVWSVPHRRSWIVDRTLLFRHVDQADLALAPDQILPATVILLAWPTEEELTRAEPGTVLLETWRQLFHASTHQAVERAWEDGTLHPARMRGCIEAIGASTFEEIRGVLFDENVLSSEARERTVFNEFVAVFLELHYFAPVLLPSFFPGLRDPAGLKRLFDEFLPADQVLFRTRLPGAPDPRKGESRPSEANEYFHELEVSSEQALGRGNVVYAAIELQRAVRVAPGDRSPQTRAKAEQILNELVDRLGRALELPESESDGWRRLLPILLEKGDQGSRPAEASLLYDLQTVCLDHEREIYKLDLAEWLLNAGRRPLRRPLPSQRLVRITRTLRSAMPNLTAARLSDHDRADLEGLLQRALHRSEDRVRTRFRPILTNALQDVGLSPKNALEETAFRKMVEELLDRIIDSGFLSFSDIRDTISRNQLKLPDLGDPLDFVRGDPLIRLDRRLVTVLDGVYRPGEFYLRWLERGMSFNFGTRWGRALTKLVTIPAVGGFLLLEAILLLLHLFHKSPPEAASSATLIGLGLAGPEALFGLAAACAKVCAPRGAGPGGDEPWDMVFEPDVADVLPRPVYYGLWGLFAFAIVALLHSASLRERVTAGLYALARGIKWAVVDYPFELARSIGLTRLFDSWPFRFFTWYVFKPTLLTALLAYLVPRLRYDYFELGIAFFASNFVVNTRPGELFWETLLKLGYDFYTGLRAGLIPGLFRFVVRLYKRIHHGLESALFAIDEWLRFRGGESRFEMWVRAALTLVWMPVSYVARFNLVVFIEPCLHPLKFPVCSIAAKFLYPLTPVIKPAMTAWMAPVLGSWLTSYVVWWVVFWLPDVFGFVFWELKENWTLYRANRRRTVEPAPVGLHGETVRRLFEPGFHSGALPKLFAKIRSVELKAFKSGNYSAVRVYRGQQAELEGALARFLQREFCSLLEQVPSWRDRGLRPGRVDLSSNQVRFRVEDPRRPDEPIGIAFESCHGWLVARCDAPRWFADLTPEAHAALHNALALLYKAAGADLVREHVRSLLAPPAATFDVTPTGLAVWSADRAGAPTEVRLRETDLDEPNPEQALAWDPQRVVFSERRLAREDAVRAFADPTSPRLFPDMTLVPSPAPTSMPATPGAA